MTYSIINLVEEKSEQLRQAGERAIENAKLSGSPACYRDNDCPGGIVKEYPDGQTQRD